jgi:carbamoyl-phosphate synthase large subunit
MGFLLWATQGTAAFLEARGLPVRRVKKVREGRPHVVDHIKNGEVQLVINTALGKKSVAESYSIRRTTLTHQVPYTTTVAGARAVALAIEALQKQGISVKSIQEYHEERIR